jgi:hypothetical protein
MTTKFPSPLLGYNNNVRHKGKVFHIQTEDSGVKYGHIITHLFMDGGRILKSVKTGYAEYIGNERMADIVREMMKQQHKAMFIALRDGKFDTMAEGAADASQATKALSADPPIPPEAPAPPRKATPPPAPAVTAPRPAAGPPVPRVDEEVEAPATVRQPPPELSLDIDALERAAVANAASPVLRSQSELPPPPANLFRDKQSSGRYRVTPVPPAASTGPAQPPRAGATSPSKPAPAAPAGGAPQRRPSAANVPAGERRYAPTRPAAIFGQPRPQQPPKSAFGEDLISDKSLDEVILSYLAEDLDEKK